MTEGQFRPVKVPVIWGFIFALLFCLPVATVFFALRIGDGAVAYTGSGLALSLIFFHGESLSTKFVWQFSISAIACAYCFFVVESLLIGILDLYGKYIFHRHESVVVVLVSIAVVTGLALYELRRRQARDSNERALGSFTSICSIIAFCLLAFTAFSSWFLGVLYIEADLRLSFWDMHQLHYHFPEFLVGVGIGFLALYAFRVIGR